MNSFSNSTIQSSDVPATVTTYPVVEPKPKRRERNPEVTKKHIYDALVRMARSKGIHNVKINDLAREARISKELIYRYFKDLKNLVELYRQTALQLLDEELAGRIPAHGSIEELRDAIKRIYHIRSEFYYNNQDLRVIVLNYINKTRMSPDGKPDMQRPTGLAIKAALSAYPFVPVEKIDEIDALFTAAHLGLMLYMESTNSINNIKLSESAGRNRIHALIDSLIDAWLEPYINREKRDCPDSINCKAVSSQSPELR